MRLLALGSQPGDRVERGPPRVLRDPVEVGSAGQEVFGRATLPTCARVPPSHDAAPESTGPGLVANAVAGTEGKRQR